MATCKDCINYDVCSKMNTNCDRGNHCEMFKDREKFVKLPCKVGDTVYYITGLSRKIIKPAIVKEITINCNGVSKLSVETNALDFESPFVSTFYLTKEEAERTLKNENRTME